jgi:hypothetical protein
VRSSVEWEVLEKIKYHLSRVGVPFKLPNDPDED